MPEVTVALPRLHTGQTQLRAQIADANARFAVTMCGRQFGKTTDGSEWIADGALTGLACAWMAPTYKYLTPVWADLKKRLQPVTLRVSEQEKKIDLYGGGSIECWTLDDPDAGRSRNYDRIVIDEAGIVRGLRDIWQMSVYATLVRRGGQCRFYGTPKGRTHDFSNLFARGESGEPGWVSLRARTADNPYIPREEIEAARHALPPQVFAQEFEGIPSDDGGNPFGLDAIRRCVHPISANPPVIWGWDFARAQDWTVGVALDAQGAVCRFERWQLEPWGETCARVVRLTGETRAYGDSTGIGDVVVEMIQRQRVHMDGVHFSRPEKQQLMERLAAAIQQQQITFPAGELVNELETFQYEYYAGGVRYAAPDGLHDDCVMALALAVKGYVPQKIRVDRTPAGKLAHQAHPLKIEDGKLVKPPKMPQTVAELADWAADRAASHRLPKRERERLPRRHYT